MTYFKQYVSNGILFVTFEPIVTTLEKHGIPGGCERE